MKNRSANILGILIVIGLYSAFIAVVVLPTQHQTAPSAPMSEENKEIHNKKSQVINPLKEYSKKQLRAIRIMTESEKKEAFNQLFGGQ